MNAVIFVLLIFIGVGSYFFPSLVAQARNTKHPVVIFSLNLIFGWTVIGWIALLIWAVRQQQGSEGAPTSRNLVEADFWIFDPSSATQANGVEQDDGWILGPEHFVELPHHR